MITEFDDFLPVPIISALLHLVIDLRFAPLELKFDELPFNISVGSLLQVEFAAFEANDLADILF
jgi:hypothetical protein